MPEPRTIAPLATYARALTLGAVSGLRSMTGMAALTLAAQPEGPYHALSQAAPPWRWLGTRAALIGFGLAAAGEYVGDKLPLTPSRVSPAPLGGRILFGALAGATLCRASDRSPLLGGALGGVGALGGAFAGYAYRTGLARRTGVPDLPLAIAEDAFAIAVALAATRG